MTFEKLEQLRKEDFKRRERDGFVSTLDNFSSTVSCRISFGSLVSNILMQIKKELESRVFSSAELFHYANFVYTLQLWLLLGLKSIVKYF